MLVCTLSQSQVKEILQKYCTIAVVGLSDKEEKPSHEVAAYMKRHGYRIIPVNPFVEEVLGEKSYKSLLDMPAEIQKTVEIVDIFRRPADVTPIVQQAIQLKQVNGKPFVIWMQAGIVNVEAAEKARKAGLVLVMDRCIMVEHNNLSSA
jgi:predicted CoA-binding protein